MDKIVVRTNNDMKRVIDWASSQGVKLAKVPFSTAEIDFCEEGLLLRFKDCESGDLHFSLIASNNQIAAWRFSLATEEIKDLHISGNGDAKVKIGMLLATDDTVGKCIRKFKALMLFATHYREDIERHASVIKETSVGKDKKKRRARSGCRLTSRKYVVDDRLTAALPHSKRKYEKVIDSFSVRGHYRTLKSGRMIWVKPFVKGDPQKCKDKKYFI